MAVQRTVLAVLAAQLLVLLSVQLAVQTVALQLAVHFRVQLDGWLAQVGVQLLG